MAKEVELKVTRVFPEICGVGCTKSMVLLMEYVRDAQKAPKKSGVLPTHFLSNMKVKRGDIAEVITALLRDKWAELSYDKDIQGFRVRMAKSPKYYAEEIIRELSCRHG